MSLFGSETLKPLGWAAICLSLVGVVLLVSPSTICFWSEDEPSKTQAVKGHYPYFSYGVVCSLCGSLSSTMVCAYSRKLGTRVNPHLNYVLFGTFIILCSPVAVHLTTQEDGSGSMASIMGWFEFKIFLVMAAVGWVS